VIDPKPLGRTRVLGCADRPVVEPAIESDTLLSDRTAIYEIDLEPDRALGWTIRADDAWSERGATR